MDIWFPGLPKKLQAQIVKLQKSAIRNMAKKQRLTHSTPLFKQHGLLRVEDKLEFIYAKTLIKAYDSSIPDLPSRNRKELPLPSGLEFHYQFHKTNTRSGIMLKTQTPRQQDKLIQLTLKANRDTITDKGLSQKRRLYHIKNNYLDNYITTCQTHNCYICTINKII